MRRVPAVVVTLIGVSLGLQTWVRNLDYRTGIALWNDTAEKLPLNPRAHSQLATLYLEVGDVQRSLEHLERTIRLKPADIGAVFRGAVHLRMRQYELAIADFDRCLEINPAYAEAYQNRGLARLELRDFAGAAADFTRAIELGPQLVRSYRYRALAYSSLNRLADAEADAREYVRRHGQVDDALRRILVGQTH